MGIWTFLHRKTILHAVFSFLILPLCTAAFAMEKDEKDGVSRLVKLTSVQGKTVFFPHENFFKNLSEHYDKTAEENDLTLSYFCFSMLCDEKNLKIIKKIPKKARFLIQGIELCESKISPEFLAQVSALLPHRLDVINFRADKNLTTFNINDLGAVPTCKTFNLFANEDPGTFKKALQLARKMGARNLSGFFFPPSYTVIKNPGLMADFKAFLNDNSEHAKRMLEIRNETKNSPRANSGTSLEVANAITLEGPPVNLEEIAPFLIKELQARKVIINFGKVLEEEDLFDLFFLTLEGNLSLTTMLCLSFQDCPGDLILSAKNTLKTWCNKNNMSHIKNLQLSHTKNLLDALDYFGRIFPAVKEFTLDRTSLNSPQDIEIDFMTKLRDSFPKLEKITILSLSGLKQNTEIEKVIEEVQTMEKRNPIHVTSILRPLRIKYSPGSEEQFSIGH